MFAMPHRIALGLLYAWALWCVVAAAGAAEDGKRGPLQLNVEERAYLANTPEVRVGVARVEWPPYELLVDGPRLSGLSGSYLDLASRRAGFNTRVVVYPTWQAVLAALAAREIDMVVSVSETPQRRPQMRFTRPYLQNAPVIVTRVDNTTVDTLDSLAGRRVVIEQAFAPAERIASEYPTITLVQVSSTLHALVDVATGAADAYVGNALTVAALIDRHRLSSLHLRATASIAGGDIRFATRPDLPQLAAILDKCIATVTHAEEQELRARWVPVLPSDPSRIEALALTDDEREWLRRHPVIRMGAAAGGMPWMDFDPQGKPLGIASDYAALLQKMLGVRIEIVRKEVFRDSIEAARRREVDMLVAVAHSPRRETFLDFTAPFLEMQWAMVQRVDTRRDLGELTGMSEGVVAVVDGHVMHEALITRYPRVKPLPVTDTRAVLAAVASGKADAGIGPLEALMPTFVDRYVRELRVTSVLRDPGTGMRIAVRKDWPEFTTIANKVLATVSPQERAAIHARWRPVDVTPGGLQWRTVLTWAVPVLAALLATMAVFVVVNRRLRREVALRRETERELALARDAAEAASRAKSTFLATMSHEIRTPMNAVMGLLELLSRSPLNRQQQQSVATVRESGRGLLTLMDEILEFSRIEADRVEIRPQPASLRAVVDSTLNVFSGMASEKGLMISASVEPGVAAAHAFDALRMRQILNNLVSNAVKFTDQGSVTIRVGAAPALDGKQGLEIVVADTGIGISDELRRRLFRPFEQGGARARQAGGTGLGLSICLRLAQLQGGDLTLDSEAGRGTTARFKITLPVADPALVGQSTPNGSFNVPLELRAAPTRDVAQAEGTLVLVAEDHPTNLRLMLQQLQTLGYACDGAADGREALDRWRTTRYGLLITDCNMPELNGYDLARAIRAQTGAAGDGARPPIIACTANASQDEFDRCLAAGIDDLLVKPVELYQLAERLARWCPLPRDMAAPQRVEPRATVSLDSADGGDAPIDPARLQVLAAANPKAFRDMLDEFTVRGAEDAEKLLHAWAARDLVIVRSMAHQMGGAAAVIGARHLQDVTMAIENAVRDGHASLLSEHIGVFEREAQRVLDYARSRVAQAGAAAHATGAPDTSPAG